MLIDPYEEGYWNFKLGFPPMIFLSYLFVSGILVIADILATKHHVV